MKYDDAIIFYTNGQVFVEYSKCIHFKIRNWHSWITHSNINVLTVGTNIVGIYNTIELL
jgi:hypothetical protein